LAGILTKEKKRLRVLNKYKRFAWQELSYAGRRRKIETYCVACQSAFVFNMCLLLSWIILEFTSAKKKIAKGAMVPNTSRYDIKIHRVANQDQDQDLGANTERRNHGY